MNATTILCILLLSLYLVLAVFWIVRSIIDTIDDRKREKRNAALEAEREERNAKWEAERQQLERERAIRDVLLNLSLFNKPVVYKGNITTVTYINASLIL